MNDGALPSKQMSKHSVFVLFLFSVGQKALRGFLIFEKWRLEIAGTDPRSFAPIQRVKLLGVRLQLA